MTTLSFTLTDLERRDLASVLATLEDREFPLQIELEHGYLEIDVDDSPFAGESPRYSVMYLPRRLYEIEVLP